MLGATRSMHTCIEVLELPDTAAPPDSFPCPGAASSTLPCSCPSTASWKRKKDLVLRLMLCREGGGSSGGLEAGMEEGPTEPSMAVLVYTHFLPLSLWDKRRGGIHGVAVPAGQPPVPTPAPGQPYGKVHCGEERRLAEKRSLGEWAASKKRPLEERDGQKVAPAEPPEPNSTRKELRCSWGLIDDYKNLHGSASAPGTSAASQWQPPTYSSGRAFSARYPRVLRGSLEAYGDLPWSSHRPQEGEGEPAGGQRQPSRPGRAKGSCSEEDPLLVCRKEPGKPRLVKSLSAVGSHSVASCGAQLLGAGRANAGHAGQSAASGLLAGPARPAAGPRQTREPLLLVSCRTNKFRKNDYKWVAASAKTERTEKPQLRADLDAKPRRSATASVPGASPSKYKWKASSPSASSSSSFRWQSEAGSKDHASQLSPVPSRFPPGDRPAVGPSSLKPLFRSCLARQTLPCMRSGLPGDKKSSPPPAATAKSQFSLRRRQTLRGKSSPVLKKTPNKGLMQVSRHRLCCLPPSRAHLPTKEGTTRRRGSLGLCWLCSLLGPTLAVHLALLGPGPGALSLAEEEETRGTVPCALGGEMLPGRHVVVFAARPSVYVQLSPSWQEEREGLCCPCPQGAWSGGRQAQGRLLLARAMGNPGKERHAVEEVLLSCGLRTHGPRGSLQTGGQR
ncbi:hypothetical protein E2I00_000167 [Balaenoptera physalus]|uniref:Uncharacterized protein n=1 Tax=Balaenoptera physalus TaxID=9770 RepID=A0A6A1Q9Y5_BALPH|nr:hypothetical protein E2I00_000167 [Balaenoptera physalus]